MRPWRSELAVPGDNDRMIDKAATSDADVVFLDLEDAVAPGEKEAARAVAAKALAGREWGGKRVGFRINALDTPYFYRDLIDVIELARTAVTSIVIPKINRPEDVYVVETLITQLERQVGHTGKINFEVQIETAEGLINCERIAAASSRVEAVTFGPGDFAASTGMPSKQIGAPDSWDAGYPGHRWHYAMSRIVIAARAAGVRAIDGPYSDFRDLDGLRRSCEVARALGFDGKWCIHPGQIPVVNEIFMPMQAEIAWARRVLAEYQTAMRERRGSLAIDGKMIDAASVRMAERTLSAVPEVPQQ
jgi:citrate lyase beta subunit